MKIKFLKLSLAIFFVTFGLFKLFNVGIVESYVYFMIGLIFYFLFKLSK